MKKIRLFALVFMMGAFFFIFNEESSAKPAANYCLLPGEACTVQGSCCSKICCLPNDAREVCQWQESNTCY